MTAKRKGYAEQVKSRMRSPAGLDLSLNARTFDGEMGTKLGASHGGGQVALVGFMNGDLSEPSEVHLTPERALELAVWLTDAAAAEEAPTLALGKFLQKVLGGRK